MLLPGGNKEKKKEKISTFFFSSMYRENWLPHRIDGIGRFFVYIVDNKIPKRVIHSYLFQRVVPRVADISVL